MLYIGLMYADDRRNSTVYFSNLSPDDENFDHNMTEFRDKRHFCHADGNVTMPSDIAIGVLENVLQAAGTEYQRIDF